MSIKDAVGALAREAQADPKLSGAVYLQVFLSEAPVSERQTHPILIPLPHKVRRNDETTVCLVVKDPAGPVSKALTESPLVGPLFDEIIGVGKLRRRVAGGRKTGKTTKATELFAKSFTLICVQDKVDKPLVDTLGIGFYKRARHLPVVVPLDPPVNSDQSQRKLKFVVKKALKSTQLILKPDSKSSSVVVGHTKMDPARLAENVEAAIHGCTPALPRGLGATAKFYIKSPESLALPVSI